MGIFSLIPPRKSLLPLKGLPALCSAGPEGFSSAGTGRVSASVQWPLPTLPWHHRFGETSAEPVCLACLQPLHLACGAPKVE